MELGLIFFKNADVNYKTDNSPVLKYDNRFLREGERVFLWVAKAFGILGIEFVNVGGDVAVCVGANNSLFWYCVFHERNIRKFYEISKLSHFNPDERF